MTNTEPNPIELVRERLDGGRKWVKDTYNDGLGNVCLAGACDELLALNQHEDVLSAIDRTAREQFPDRVHYHHPDYSVPEFNDHYATTFADVDLVLDKASVAWDEQVR